MRKLLFAFAMMLSLAVSAQSIEGFVKLQMQTYPKSRLLDIYKSCFQDYMGAEHLVSNRQMVKTYLDEELEQTKLEDLQSWYYEPCGIDSCYFRVSLRAVIEGLIAEDALIDAFIRSANTPDRPTVEDWSEQWHKIMGTIDQMRLDLPQYDEDRQFIEEVLSAGKYAISHSSDYRETYHPHYRIIERRIFEREFKPLLQ